MSRGGSGVLGRGFFVNPSSSSVVRKWRPRAIINPHQRCGSSDSPFARKDTFLYCRVQKWVGGGLAAWIHRNQKKFSRRKIYFFVIEKCVREVKQGQKIAPDLVESIMRPTRLVKEELRRILMKINTFRFQIEEFRACTFWISGKITDFRQRLPAGAK